MGGLEMRRSGEPIFFVGTLGAGAGAGVGSANTCMLSVPLPAFLPFASLPLKRDEGILRSEFRKVPVFVEWLNADGRACERVEVCVGWRKWE
jgi:hypothetical protein